MYVETKNEETMERKYSQKEMENAVMLAADLYQKFYNAASTPGGSLEVANVIIGEAVKMEQWLVEKYGEDDEEYLDRLEEYEAMLEKEYGLEENVSGYFSISSLHRDDLEAAGFDASNVDDATMERMADKMGDDYVTQLFWEHLPFFAEEFDVPRKEGWSEEEDDE